MRMYDIINNKKNGLALSDEEIRFFVDGYTKGEIPDYQASALLMAIYFQGMDKRETTTLTHAMSYSGDVIDLSGINGVTVDKHSTGGVGDKTTLIVAPIVAALGCKVAKMSGRGLGHTGGTVDKLESIPGFRTALDTKEFIQQTNDIGICVIGQTGNLAPADKKLYALRDVTATVDNIALIASSIMSKKLAAGASRIVLDVKYGSGAFMKTPEEAKELAQSLVDIGNGAGKPTVALITNMDVPLGNAIGNALEIAEAIEILNNRGCKQLREVCVALAANIVYLATGEDIAKCQQKVEQSIANGSATQKLKEMVIAQGGDVTVIENPERFEKAMRIKPIKAKRSGYITHMDAEKIGISSVVLGAGRETKEDSIDFSAGIILKAKTGDYVNAGDELCMFHTSSEDKYENAKELFHSAITYSDEKPAEQALIYGTVK